VEALQGASEHSLVDSTPSTRYYKTNNPIPPGEKTGTGVAQATCWGFCLNGLAE